ncbi:MAG TPA: SufE family protein [Deinococcales bacterium]|nr:SufE family protein [Deinococcales bacterium]
MNVPDSLSTIIDSFSRAPQQLRLPLLLEYAGKVRELPEQYRGHEGMEQVHECQTPFFVASELTDGGAVRLFFGAPDEAPTTRGFAGILQEGLDGLEPGEILGVPGDFYQELGLTELISPLRLRGMEAILGRLKRQVRELNGSA